MISLRYHQNNVGQHHNGPITNTQLALEKKLANAIKSYHKQTETSNLNLADSKANLIIYLLKHTLPWHLLIVYTGESYFF